MCRGNCPDLSKTYYKNCISKNRWSINYFSIKCALDNVNRLRNIFTISKS